MARRWCVRPTARIALVCFVVGVGIAVASSATPPEQKAALLDLYSATSARPDVLQWWNGSDPCTAPWARVTCSNSTVM